MPQTAALDALRDAFIARGLGGAHLMPGGRDVMMMEAMVPDTRQTYLCPQPVTQAEFDAFAPAPPFIKTGLGRPGMDMAAFIRSPGKPGLEQISIGGRPFLHVANPVRIAMPASPGLPLELAVDKHHVLGFAAGSVINLLRGAQGQIFVPLVGDDAGDAALALPAGLQLIRRRVTAPWLVELPAPTQAYFWGLGAGPGALRSFQGPLPGDAAWLAAP